MSCRCKTLKDTICKNKAIAGSLYCSRHQKCAKDKRVRGRIPDVGGDNVSKKVIAKNKRAFNKNFVLMLKDLPEGELKKVCNLNKVLQNICKKNAEIRKKLAA